jgi:hypothetical protein
MQDRPVKRDQQEHENADTDPTRLSQIRSADLWVVPGSSTWALQ